MNPLFLLFFAAASFGSAHAPTGPNPSKVNAIRWICFGERVPKGYVIVNDGTEYTACDYDAQVRRTNIQYVQDISASQTGTVVQVCLYSAVPAGWTMMEEGKDLNCNCSHDVIERNNVKYIRKD